jgi:hypothetical protein
MHHDQIRSPIVAVVSDCKGGYSNILHPASAGKEGAPFSPLNTKTMQHFTYCIHYPKLDYCQHTHRLRNCAPRVSALPGADHIRAGRVSAASPDPQAHLSGPTRSNTNARGARDVLSPQIICAYSHSLKSNLATPGSDWLSRTHAVTSGTATATDHYPSDDRDTS